MVSVNIGIANGVDTCTPRLLQAPWEFDGEATYGPGASLWDKIPQETARQGELPQLYRELSSEQLHERIMAAKETLGEKLVMLGHFYQRDEIVQYADYIGDSFQLARAAQQHGEAEHIVFCGVHFMAETAAVLSQPHQRVILPNLAAGCSMADMADEDSVEDAWEQLEEVLGEAQGQLIPVTYMNSSAALKAFCGRHGGVVCTSSNAVAVLRWAFSQGRRVLFFPDQHLGRNTALRLRVAEQQIVLWRRLLPLGGLSQETIKNSRVILWDGFCSVHKRFTVKQIQQAREKSWTKPLRVIVHPECTREVVDAADESGSTDYITKAIAAAEEPTVFAIGTEINLVNRLANQYPQHEIFCLDPVVCPCSTMYRIHPSYLAWVLDELVQGRTVNEITVSDSVKKQSLIALERMLQLPPDQCD